MNPIRICMLLAVSWLLPTAVITAAALGAFQRPDIILISVGILAATMVAFLVGARRSTLVSCAAFMAVNIALPVSSATCPVLLAVIVAIGAGPLMAILHAGSVRTFVIGGRDTATSDRGAAPPID